MPSVYIWLRRVSGFLKDSPKTIEMRLFSLVKHIFTGPFLFHYLVL